MHTRFDDVLVVLPGIMGSTLLDRHGHEVWGQEAALLHGVALGGIGRLRLEDGVGDEHPGDGVVPGVLMPGIHAALGAWSTSLGYTRLLTHLTQRYPLIPWDPADPERPANFVPFAYDWRLSNRYNGRRLRRTVEPVLERWRRYTGRQDARLVFVCHSMGGLVARWFADREGGHELTRTIVTVGTPHRGSLMAVDRLVNGVRLKLGPVGFNLSDLARSLPSLQQLLPAYACVDDGGRMHTLTEYAPLPAVLTGAASYAAAFHRDLAVPAAGYRLRPIVGIDNPTKASVRFGAGGMSSHRTMRLPDGTPAGEQTGDGTVPRFAAYPGTLDDTDPSLHFAGQTHGGLPGHPATLEQLSGVLDGAPIAFRSTAFRFGVAVDDVTTAGSPVRVYAEAEDHRALLQARVVHEQPGGGEQVVARGTLTNLGDGRFRADLHDVPPGGYTVRVGRLHPAGHLLDTVTAATVVTEVDTDGTTDWDIDA